MDLESFTPSLLASSATAGSLLVAVLAFLYNVLRSLQKQHHESVLLHAKARTRYESDMDEKMKSTGCSRSVKGGAGTRGDVDFEWVSEIWAPVTQELSRPETLKSDFLGLSRPFISIRFVDSTVLGALMNFEENKSLDSLIEQFLKGDVHFHFIWSFVREPPDSLLGTLYVQTAFLSRLPKKMQSISNTLRMISVSIVVFVVTIALAILSVVRYELGLSAFATYFVGWGLVLVGVKHMWSLVPTVQRRKKLPTAEIKYRL